MWTAINLQFTELVLVAPQVSNSSPVVQLETITCDCLGVALHGCEPGKAELAVPE